MWKFLSGVYYGKYEKAVHFTASFMMFIIFVFFMPWPYAALLSFLIGVAKEIFDKTIKKSKFDLYDLLADIFGILSAIIIYFGFLSLY